MPLASSRSASLKREKAVEKERKENERRNRLSLPMHCDSSTVVTESKARRRQSLRRQSLKENQGPYSPPITRSAKKKRKSRLPPQEKKGSGFMLNFSPPNQQLNEEREKERIKREDQARQLRVSEARQNGQLLMFSPTHRDPPEIEASSSLSGKDISIAASDASVNQSSLTDTNPSNDAELFKSLMERIDAKLGSVGTADQEVIHMKIDILNEKIECLEKEKEQLKGEIREATSKLMSVRETHLVEKTRLESEVEGSKREADVRVHMLEEAQVKLHEQMKLLQEEKAVLMARAKELEGRVQVAADKLEESKATLDALRKDAACEKEQLVIDNKKLQNLNSDFSQQVSSLQRANEAIEQKLVQYEKEIRQLEEHLTKSQSNSDAVNTLLRQKDDRITELGRELGDFQSLVGELKNEMIELNRENEDERQQLQQLKQESSASIAKTENEAAEKSRKIGELFKQLGDLQQLLAKERKDNAAAIAALQSDESEKDARIVQINAALEDALDQLDRVEQAKKALEDKLERLMEEQKQNMAGLEKKAQTEYEGHQDALHRIAEVERQMSQSDTDAQRRIRELERERDEALTHMAGFNDREQELYRRLRESDRIRRSLHGRVIQLMGNIRVFVRVRPPLPGELEQERRAYEKEVPDNKKRKRPAFEETLFRFPGIYDNEPQQKRRAVESDDMTKNIVEVTEPYKDRGGLSERRKKWKYAFDGVFSPHHGQEDIWEATEPLIQCAVDGFNVTLFAYGQTGAGKTYTMLGGEGTDEGVIGRAVHMLYRSKQEIESLSKGDSQVELSVELLEIYNEKVRDLLAPKSRSSGKEIDLKVTSQEVVGNVVVRTSTKDEVMQVLSLAQKQRCTKATSSNSESSRSHMLFIIHFVVTSKDGMKREGKLNICDLAGSERLSKSGTNNVGGALLKETQHINKSLSALSNVIERLQQGSDNVPFRESKLTYLLQNSLGGNSKTLAIVCCNPLPSHFGESNCSLRFAQKVNKVDLKQSTANFTC